MPRLPRLDKAGLCFHVLNRANDKLEIFKRQIDYNEFIWLIKDGLESFKIDIFGFCIMPTHWHIVCRPNKDGEMSKFIKWISQVHTQRWHKRYKNIGTGHFYQGRYKSFLIKDDHHFLTVCRYVERNPVRADLVKKIEEWPWSSAFDDSFVSKWPIHRSKNYFRLLNKEQSKIDLEFIRNSIKKSCPYGDLIWKKKVVKKFNLESTIRPIGRPKKGA